MLAGPVRAQSSLTPDEYNALVSAVESTPSQPASAAPIFGNFYTITHGESWPPLPSDTLGLNFWSLGGNVFLLDDRDYSYSASWADFEPPPSLTNVGSGGSGGNPYFTPPVYTTNDLVLSNKSVIDGVANLVIYPPYGVTNGVYNLLYTTNPATPLPWEWLMETAPGQTSVFVTNATDPLGFYRLGPQSYWLVFPNMDVGRGTEALSLYITSPVAVTGTIKIAGHVNGPILTVGNSSSDPEVLGTYALTNTYLSPTNYGLTGAPVTNYYVKGSYVIFYDNAVEFFPSYYVGWILVDSANSNGLYYDSLGPRDLNDAEWGLLNDNSYPSAPTTSCAELVYVQSFSLTNGAATNISIPNDALMSSDLAIDTNTAIAVTADEPISVFAVDYNPQLTAAYSIYPASMLGTNYCVLAWPSLPLAGYSEFSIVATADNTSVQIVPCANADFGIEGTNILLALQAGQSYEVESLGNFSDASGTLVTSDKPIAVFAGASDAFVPTNSTGFDNPLMQEQFPVNEWGTNALALSFAGRTGGDSYRVLAAQDGTDIYTNGALVASNLQAGAPLDLIIDGGVEMTANKPIQVAHLGNGHFFDLASSGDPCEIILPSTNYYSLTNLVVTPVGDFTSNYVNIITAHSAISNVLVDNVLVGASNFTNIGASGFYGARFPITSPGPHVIVSSQPAGVEAYGWGTADSYGYFGGMVK